MRRWTFDVDFCHLRPARDQRSLNSVSTIFIATGWYLIRRGHWRQHIACMITAVLSSTLFLVGYVIYHAHVGEQSTRFTAQGSSAHFISPF